MPIKTTSPKSYQIAVNREDPGTASLPTVNLQFEPYTSNPDKFNAIIIVLNSLTAVLEKQVFSIGKDGEEYQIGNSEFFDVQNTRFKTFEKDRVYQLRFILTASNSVGSVSTEVFKIDPANVTVIDLPDQVIVDFTISREANTYDLVNSQLTLGITEFFDISKLFKLELFYKRKDFQSWRSIDLSKTNFKLLNGANGKPEGYLFDYKKQSIIRTNIGGFFDFYIKVSFNENTAQNTEVKTLFFDNINNTEPQRQTDSSVSTDIIDIDNPATVRYEILTKFSEIYTISNNSVTVDQNAETIKQNDNKEHYFLDTTVYKGLSADVHAIRNPGDIYLFYYEANSSKKTSETKGHFYPASVSEINPCIITNKDGNQNKSIVLYWKINDNFFEYSFFENNISIATTLFQVKLQYYSSGSYVDLTDPITITKDGSQNKKFGFFSKYQKFIMSIERSDLLPGKDSIFDVIDELDNNNYNLRLLVVRHDVDCFYYNAYKSYSFDKMLIPHQWKYIAYDKYISNDSRTVSDKKINLDLNDAALRGIRLPTAGFYEYDKLTDIKTFSSDSNGNSSITTSNLKILYKLACEYDVFYRDPVLEGTINSILLPSIPKDVFLIPPTLKIPPPNLVPESAGGRQAEGIVKLNEYGKITGIQITDPGSGYSLFKTSQSKREQTFTDLVPFVKKSFQVVATDLNINRSVLTLQNNSFDKDKLKASLQGGVRLASAYFDKLKLEENNGNPFSVEQKARLDEYLNFYIPPETREIENSVERYDLESTEEEKDLSSIGILDETWNIISKLYTDKNINPLEQSQVYTEDTDAGVSEIGDSDIPSSINSTKDSSSITPISLNGNSLQQSADGGSPQLFSLNNLIIVPDASAAVFISSKSTPPPWLTLLPLSVRADGQYGFGPLPNMAPRAEMFNRLVMGINNLNEVRVILPMIWALDEKNTVTEYYQTSLGENEYNLISFDTAGQKISNSSESSAYLPINSILSISASRSVGRSRITAAQVEERGLSAVGLGAGVYKISSEDSRSLTFKPFVHPLMAASFKESYLRTFKRKILGIVTESTTTCVNNQAPIGVGGYRAIGCNGLNNDPYERSVPEGTLIPTENVNTNTYFAFFDAGASINAPARGTAQALSLSNGANFFCTYGCGDAYSKTIDFTYANMFPGTIKI